MRKKSPINRRHFLKKSTLGVIGAGMAAKTGFSEAKQQESSPAPKIKGYRTLGRTGFKVSDISLGYTMDEGIIGTALDAGMNYIEEAKPERGFYHNKTSGSGRQVQRRISQKISKMSRRA